MSTRFGMQCLCGFMATAKPQHLWTDEEAARESSHQEAHSKMNFQPLPSDRQVGPWANFFDALGAIDRLTTTPKS